MIGLILFDLDGTLADTAPDLAAAANLQRKYRGLADLPYEQLRPVASQGAKGLLRVALDMEHDHPEYLTTRTQFLADYERDMMTNARLFDGVPALLEQIQAAGMRWGIVTNKMAYLAKPMVQAFGLDTHCASLVCGDTTPTPKPHPAPLLHAATEAGFSAQQCIYVGDDVRDIQAGKAAHMPTIAVSYGYCGDAHPPSTWQADHVAHNVLDIWAGIKSIQQNKLI